MTRQPQTGDRDDVPLDQIVAEFLQSVERGEVPDRQLILNRHPQYATELQDFFRNHDRIQQMGASSTTEGWLGQRDAFDQRELMDDSGRSDTLLSTSAAHSTHMAWGRYELLEEIGRGGMGIVFKARQNDLDRVVALKMILSGRLAGSPEIERFHAEARTAAGLHHPGIVPIYEVDQFQGHHFYSMEWVEGESLADRIGRQPMASREAAQLLKQIAEATAYAHQHGVVHRDLKPANIVLDRQGDPKLTDFGLAKCLHDDQGLTVTGQMVGTVHYMAPEQALGTRQVFDPSVDVYSLGAILYFMCAGRPPFQADNHLDLLLQVIEGDVQSPRVGNPEVPRELELICLRCLQKDPRRRYRSAEELVADLERFLQGEPVEAAAVSWWHRARVWARRRPVLVAHWIALSFIELVRQVSFGLTGVPASTLVGEPAEDTGIGVHLWVSGILILNLCASIVLQWLMLQPRWSERTRFVWAGLDICCLTLALSLLPASVGPLLMMFGLLIVSSGLYFRVRLVAFTTISSLLAYLTLLVIRPEIGPSPGYSIILATVLVAIGYITGLQVHRLRALNRYFGRTV